MSTSVPIASGENDPVTRSTASDETGQAPVPQFATPKEWLELLYKSGDRINYYWRFSVAVNVIIIGWLVAMREHSAAWTTSLQMTITIVHFWAYIMCVCALLKEYVVLHAIHNQCVQIAAQFDPNLGAAIRGAVIGRSTTLVLVSHIVYLVLIWALIWSPDTMFQMPLPKHAP